jgi:hypothetical protein
MASSWRPGLEERGDRPVPQHRDHVLHVDAEQVAELEVDGDQLADRGGRADLDEGPLQGEHRDEVPVGLLLAGAGQQQGEPPGVAGGRGRGLPFLLLPGLLLVVLAGLLVPLADLGDEDGGPLPVEGFLQLGEAPADGGEPFLAALLDAEHAGLVVAGASADDELEGLLQLGDHRRLGGW